MVWGETPYFGFGNLPSEEELQAIEDQGLDVCDVIGDVNCYGSAFSDARPIFSTGVSARINLLGALIVEPYYALPISRWGEDLPRGRGVFGFNLAPGW